MSEWAGYVIDDFRFEFAAGSRVLDLGCGEGAQISAMLTDQGVWACGIDLSTVALKTCRKRNVDVVQGLGERLPFLTESFDGVICKVVLPYTDERATISEIGRVLRLGGTACVVSHGAGYYLRYLLQPPKFLNRIYAVRTLLNTWLYVWTGRRLPGFLGDSLYQSRRRLLRYYGAAGLKLVREFPSQKYLGRPVFLYDQVKKISRRQPKFLKV
jgi:SAM-dependent methyltransferase